MSVRNQRRESTWTNLHGRQQLFEGIIRQGRRKHRKQLREDCLSSRAYHAMFPEQQTKVQTRRLEDLDDGNKANQLLLRCDRKYEPVSDHRDCAECHIRSKTYDSKRWLRVYKLQR